MSLFDRPTKGDDQFPEHNSQLTGHRRREARFAAAQLLYSHLLTQDSLSELHTMEVKHGRTRKFDKNYLSTLIEALSANLPRYELILERQQKTEWPLERWELMHRALLLTATADMEIAPTDVALPMLISEYLALSDGFATPEQSGFIHAVLNSIGQELRPAV